MLTINKLRPDHVLDYAAEELKKYIRMMQPDGGDVDIAYAPNAVDGFRLGLLEDFGLPNEAEDPVVDDVVHVDAGPEGGVLAGSNSRSVLFAVYRFLRLNGCRWMYPGVEGDHVPVKPLENVQYHKLADHRFRGHCNEGAEYQECMMETIEFYAKQELNVYMLEFFNPFGYYRTYYDHRRNEENRPPEPVTEEQTLQWKRMCEVEIAKRGLMFHDMGHGWTAEPFGIKSTVWLGDTPPELTEEQRKYFAVLDGEKKMFLNIPMDTNFCMSQKPARTIVATAIADYAETHQNVTYLHVWLADGRRNHCECPECSTKRPADWYLMLMNELDEILTARNLKTRIVFISYVDTMFGLREITIKNPKRFSLLYAPVTRFCTQSTNENTEVVPPQEYVRNKWKNPKTVMQPG